MATKLSIKDMLIFNLVTNYSVIEFVSKILNVDESYLYKLFSAMGTDKLSQLTDTQKDDLISQFKEQYPNVNWDLLDNEKN